MPIKSIFRLIKVIMIGNASSRIMLYLSLSKRLNQQKRFKHFIHSRMQKYGVYISPNAIIGDGIKFPHPVGIVIGTGAIIGKNVMIFQNVTLGGARIGDYRENNYPTIGNNVVIFAGAVIVGKVSIGDNATIGANAVVLSDVPAGATCVGVPGKIVQLKAMRDKV